MPLYAKLPRVEEVLGTLALKVSKLEPEGEEAECAGVKPRAPEGVT